MEAECDLGKRELIKDKQGAIGLTPNVHNDSWEVHFYPRFEIAECNMTGLGSFAA